jgi:hypothetical protein
MMGVTTTPADVLDHRTINVYHFPPGFQGDAPVVTLDTPVVNFLEVPAGETRMAAAVFGLDACERVHFTVLSGPTVTSGPAATVFGLLTSPVVADPHLDAKGRVWFTYTGTAAGDIAAGTVTIRCDETGQQFVVALTANTIARPTAALVMVLDQSNSMTFDSGLGAGITRADVLKFSAPTAVVVLEDDNAMAVCSFDHDAHSGIGMTAAAGVGKLTINAAIQSYASNPNGWTSIGEGVAFAHSVVNPVTGYDVKALVVLTDGQENHGPHTRRYISDVADLIASLNGRVFAIGLGRAEVLNLALFRHWQRQQRLHADDGRPRRCQLPVGEVLPADLRRRHKQRDRARPRRICRTGAEVRIPFQLTETDITAKAILLHTAPRAIHYRLETPDGDIIDPGIAAAHPMLSFEAGDQVALYRVGLPMPLGANSAHAGRWYARLSVDGKYFKKYLSSLDGHAALYATTAAHGVRYNFNVHAYSNLRMRAALAQTSNEPGATLTIRAVLTEYGVPVASRAVCRAELTRPDNTQTTAVMSEVNPGVFESITSAAAPGIYRFRILAEGKTLRASPFTREQILTGAVWRGGDKDPPTAKDDPTGNRDRLCSLVACLLENKGLIELLKKHGIDPNELRRCFADYCRKASPSEPVHAAALTLEGRLRSLVRDETLLRAVMDAIDPGLR